MLRRFTLVILPIIAAIALGACEAKPKEYKIQVAVEDKNGYRVEPGGDCAGDMRSEPSGRVGHFDGQKVWEIELTAKEGDKVTINYDRPCAYAKGAADITLTGETAPKVTIKLGPVEAVEVKGIIRDPKGRPLKGAVVTTHRPWDEEPFTETTADDGTFKFPFRVGERQSVRVKATHGNLFWDEYMLGGTYIDFKLQPRQD